MKSTCLKAFILATVGVLILSACSSGASEEEISTALSEGLMSDPSNPFSLEQADCIGGEIVSRVGVDRLSELEVSSADSQSFEEIPFTDEEFGSLAKSLSTCSDLNALIGAELSVELGPELANCLAEKLDTQLLEDVMVAGMTGQEPSDEVISAMAPLATECATGG